jgi:hypothetical protein
MRVIKSFIMLTVGSLTSQTNSTKIENVVYFSVKQFFESRRVCILPFFIRIEKYLLTV